MATGYVPEITSHLVAQGLNPKPTWLATLLSTQRPNVPPLALKQTALFRIVHSDITTSIENSPGNTFPSSIADATIREAKLSGPIPVQILDVEDIGKSRWNQLEAIEAEERGETTRGREIIRAVPSEDDDAAETPSRTSSGPHKLLLQDSAGTRAYGIEVAAVPDINTSMSIGKKLLLKDASVARGVILLDPTCVTVLGGKIDHLNRKWEEGKKVRLRAAVRAEEDE